MRKEVILITGANGEIGHGLINQISADKHARILAMDLKPIDECLEAQLRAIYSRRYSG